MIQGFAKILQKLQRSFDLTTLLFAYLNDCLYNMLFYRKLANYIVIISIDLEIKVAFTGSIFSVFVTSLLLIVCTIFCYSLSEGLKNLAKPSIFCATQWEL